MNRHPAAILVAGLVSFAGCSRPTPSSVPDADVSAPHQLAVRVPSALTIGRSIDALSITVDPASLASTQVIAAPGMVIGMEREVFVFPEGQPRPPLGRGGLVRGADFTASTDTWTRKRDGLPLPGTQYVVEMQFALFETDVPPATPWNPHVGTYRVLWSRTLRQAEE